MGRDLRLRGQGYAHVSNDISAYKGDQLIYDVYKQKQKINKYNMITSAYSAFKAILDKFYCHVSLLHQIINLL